MIKYEPLPLHEAYTFLSCKGKSFPLDLYFDSVLERHPNCKDEYLEYHKTITELYRRLAAAVYVGDEDIDKLFAPLASRGRKRNDISDYNFCSALFSEEHPSFDNYPFRIKDSRAFFEELYARAEYFPNFVAYDISTRYGTSEDVRRELLGDRIDTAVVFKIINESSLTQKSKLALMDAMLNTKEYIRLLEKAMLSVVDEFEGCRELWLPLIEPYRESYSGYTDGRALLAEKLNVSMPTAQKYEIHPLVTGFQQYHVTVYGDSDEVCLCIMGVLYDVFQRNSKIEINAPSEVSRIMSILGDANRFNIITRLAKGPAYGRELAKHVNLAPCTISQHLSSLVGTGLVSADIEGNKTYYSINRDSLDRFMEDLRRALYDDRT